MYTACNSVDGSLRVKRKSKRRGVSLAFDSAVSTQALRGCACSVDLPPISNPDPSRLFSTDRHALKEFLIRWPVEKEFSSWGSPFPNQRIVIAITNSTSIFVLMSQLILLIVTAPRIIHVMNAMLMKESRG
jgi:hypothetical protein